MSMTNLMHKRHINRCFSRAASRYDASADFQRFIGDELIHHLSGYCSSAIRVVDIGAGTGVTTQALTDAVCTQEIFCVDLSLPMLQLCRNNLRNVHAYFVSADFDQLPFAVNAFNVVFSNMTLQWSL